MKLDESGSAAAILDRSMQLFNDHGVEAVPILRIAQSLRMSPGNLTYYYKRKAALIDALLNRLEEQMLAGLRGFPYTSDSRSFVDAYAALFGTTWRHRALFNSAPYLIQSGLAEAARLQALSDHVTGLMLCQTQQLIGQGFMLRVKPPYDAATLVDCIWWQWLGWLRVNHLRAPDAHLEVDEIIRSGIHHCIFLVRPYMCGDYPSRLLRALEELELPAARRPLARVRRPLR